MSKFTRFLGAAGTFVWSSLSARKGYWFPKMGAPAQEPPVSTLAHVTVEDQAALQKIPKFAVNFTNLGYWRAAAQVLDQAADLNATADETHRVGAKGPVVYVYRPSVPLAEPPPAILYIHGGGMVMGRAKDNHAKGREYADMSGAVVVSVTYRLAPEHPFPAPLDDCYDALCWMRDHAAALAIDPNRISVLGHSAGGGLCCGVVHRARDQNGPTVRAYFPIYPMIDPRTGTIYAPENDLRTGEFIWTRSANRTGWRAYRGRYKLDDHRIGWFAPALDSNFADLPPCFLQTCDLDLFLPENRAYAQAIKEAGGHVDLVEYNGTVHAFDSFLPQSAAAEAYFRDLKLAFAKLL